MRDGLALEGPGIHTGQMFRVHCCSETPRSKRLEFRVVDQGDSFEAPASITRLSGTTRSTALVLRSQANQRVELRTVEHFLSAAWVLGQPSLSFEIQRLGAQGTERTWEMPVLDGSAAPWLDWLADHVLEARPLQPQRAIKKIFFRPKEAFVLKDDDKSVGFFPSESHDLRTEFVCEVSFRGKFSQRAHFLMNWMEPHAAAKDYRKRIAPARTFGFLHELVELEKRGLAKGGSLSNALVLDWDTEKVVNPEGFLMESELAAHKLLDGIGDLALLEFPILGRVELCRAGHALHLRAASEALKNGIFQRVERECAVGWKLPSPQDL